MRKLRIVVADDQTLMRDGLKTILELEDDMEVVGTAGDGREAYDLTAALAPDLVLMDVKMPLMSGVECTRRIKEDFPATNVLILTTFDEEDIIIEALANGAIGFLLKDMPSDKLVETIREGAKGHTMLPSAVAAKLASRLSLAKPPAARFPAYTNNEGITPHFTDREKEIIHLMVHSCSNKEMAEQLGISEGTIKNYVSIIYDKIGVNERLKAIAYLKERIGERGE